jgi:hypothetical protein
MQINANNGNNCNNVYNTNNNHFQDRHMFPWLKRGLFFVGDLVQLCHRQCLEWKLAEAAPWHADALDEEMEAAIQRVRVGPAV